MKDTWAQWDQAWDIGLLPEQRLTILENATTPGFVYTNMNTTVSSDLQGLVQLIEDSLQQAIKNLTVKHLKWYEQHHQSALQWDMVDIHSGHAALHGFSYASYREDGRLQSVSDFW